MRNVLPETCFATSPDSGKLIVLKRGESGYSFSDWETGDKTKNQEIADLYNGKCGIAPAQVEAMQVGSIFGFHVPDANPQIYYDRAAYVRSYHLGSNVTISLPQKAASAAVEGDLLLYCVAKKKCLYLDLQAMPEIILSKQSNIILFPDLVRGDPLIPVVARREEKGAWRLELEADTFSAKKEINADYWIIAKVRVGPVEYALGQIKVNIPFFVTWERTPANDGDGLPNYYWGHYFESRDKAIRDFCNRAKHKYKAISE